MVKSINNNENNVISKYINSDVEIKLDQTKGAFKSRTVTVGGQTCKLDRLIFELKKRITNADPNDLESIEKLKKMVEELKIKEKTTRNIPAQLIHFFSSRDKDIETLEKNAEHKAKHAKIASINDLSKDEIARRLLANMPSQRKKK